MPPIAKFISPIVGATFITSNEIVSVTDALSSSVTMTSISWTPSSSVVIVQYGPYNPSSQALPGQDMVTYWPSGETVSISPLSVALKVICVPALTVGVMVVRFT